MKIKRHIVSLLKNTNSQAIPVRWVKKDGGVWLSTIIEIAPGKSAYSSKIERLAQQTNNLGAQPLWEGNAGNNIAGPTRMPDAVRTTANM